MQNASSLMFYRVLKTPLKEGRILQPRKIKYFTWHYAVGLLWIYLSFVIVGFVLCFYCWYWCWFPFVLLKLCILFLWMQLKLCLWPHSIHILHEEDFVGNIFQWGKNNEFLKYFWCIVSLVHFWGLINTWFGTECLCILCKHTRALNSISWINQLLFRYGFRCY